MIVRDAEIELLAPAGTVLRRVVRRCPEVPPDANRLLAELAHHHPENPGGGPLREVGEMVGAMVTAVEQATKPSPDGMRWQPGGYVEFHVVDGSLLVLPVDNVARIELGPPREAPP